MQKPAHEQGLIIQISFQPKRRPLDGKFSEWKRQRSGCRSPNVNEGEVSNIMFQIDLAETPPSRRHILIIETPTTGLMLAQQLVEQHAKIG